MNRVLCSTGTCIGRPNRRDWRLLRECAQKLTCDGWEFMMYDTWYGREEEIAQFLRSLGAAFPVMHCEKGVGELLSRNEAGDTEQAMRLFETNCRMAKSIGAGTMVLHLWNGPHSDRDIEHNLRAYERLRFLAEKHGVLLTVENVVCSHADPLTHMKRMAQLYPDVRFTFDTKMAQFHGQTAEMLKEENLWLWGHIAHMHVNDYSGGYMDWKNLKTLHIGQGQVDFDALFGFLRRYGYAGDFTVEATSFDQTGTIHFDELNGTLEKLRALIG
ncbi:MAG: sugar phosphate isomerase/epimerase [Clostridia bacterium]|nr:sugar phosphate isomerase/epimerase [Clostridia bacterium]